MRLQPLYDLQQEINRLFIAGSKFATGDPRLQKHLPVLQKLGEKAPVFKKLAADLDELLQTDAQQSAEKLTTLSVLLYSVLYTQGETVDNEQETKLQTPAIPIDEVNTAYSYLQLKPVIQALTTSSSGRLDILKDAENQGVFADSRTFAYLDFALADKYTELCDYLEETVIPKIGQAILPFLLKSFRYEDKTENVRRLRLLGKLNYAEIQPMLDEILSQSLPNLQAAAIEILGNDLKNEPLIIKLADDRNKMVRTAAYKALAKFNTHESLEKLTALYAKNKNSANLPFLTAALSSTKLPFFFKEVYNQVVNAFQVFITLEKTEEDKILAAALEDVQINLQAFENKNNPEIYEFLETILQNEKFNKLIKAKKNLLEGKAADVSTEIISVLESFPEEKILNFYEKNLKAETDENWKNRFWNDYFIRSFASNYSKEKLYQIFSNATVFNRIHYYKIFYDCNAEKFDTRWLDVLYDLIEKNKCGDLDKTLRIMNRFEPLIENSKSFLGIKISSMPRFEKFLNELIKKTPAENCQEIFNLLVERNVTNCFETIYNKLTTLSKSNSWKLYHLNKRDFWALFPIEYKQKFQQLFEKTKISLFEEIADEIGRCLDSFM